MRSLTLVAALLAGGCLLFEGDAGDTYVLTRVNGADLPVTLLSESLPGGGQHSMVVSSGTLTFYSRGTYRSETIVDSEWSAAPDTAFHSRRSGDFTVLADTAVQVRFRLAGTWTRTTYRVLENGDLLRAIQSFGGTSLAVYDYRRK